MRKLNTNFGPRSVVQLMFSHEFSLLPQPVKSLSVLVNKEMVHGHERISQFAFPIAHYLRFDLHLINYILIALLNSLRII